MGYEAFGGKNFSLLVRRRGDAGTGARGLSLRKDRIVHGASLICFLIFCKRLVPAPFPSAAAIQKPLALTQEGRMTLPRADGDLPIFRAERKLVGQFVDPRVAPN
jgi:hypothetical protein